LNKPLLKRSFISQSFYPRDKFSLLFKNLDPHSFHIVHFFSMFATTTLHSAL